MSFLVLGVGLFVLGFLFVVFCVCVVLKTPSFLLSPILQHEGIANQRQNVLMTVRASSAHGMSSTIIRTEVPLHEISNLAMKASKIRNSIVLEQRERKREGEESFSEDSRLRTAVALLAKIFLGCHVAPELFL